MPNGDGGGALKLGALLTHPVQYYAPLFRAIAGTPEVELRVYYAHAPTPEEQGDGFGVPFSWDTDLLGGYANVFLENVATEPARGFWGYDTPRVDDHLRRERFDAFLVAGWHALTYWQAMRACWRVGVPVLARGDSNLRGDGARAKRLAKRAMYPWFIRRFAACLSVGVRSDEYFRYYGAHNVIRSPHFVDNAFFSRRKHELAPTIDALRERWDIPADAVVCLFSGKLIEKKRPLDVIAALAQARLPNVVALFVGDGELRGSCEEAARRAGVPARFVGFLNQSEMPSAYAVSDFLVLPSDARETWGLVVNEAMASGLPALVSRDVGCAPDLIVEGVTGHTFDRGDIAGLSSLVRQLAGNREQRRSMGEMARRHVAAFSVDAAATGIIGAAREASSPSGFRRSA